MRAVRFAILAALVPLAVLIGIAFGGAPLDGATLLHALFHPREGGDAVTIVWQLRVPRVAIAATVGAALALAGALLQALLRNPIVDPYLTGISSGAGASIAIAATAAPPASSFCAMRPPNEWPITIGLAGRRLMTSR